MSPRLGAATALLLSLALSGCFLSTEPLISRGNSVTPVPEGRYAYSDTDKTAKSVLIAHDGTVTKMTEIDDAGLEKISQLLMMDVNRPGYFVIMSSTKTYTLIRIENRTVTTYKETEFCNALGEAARAAGKALAPSLVAVQKGTSGGFDTCTFHDFNDIATGFRTLIDSNRLTPSKVYTRQ